MGRRGLLDALNVLQLIDTPGSLVLGPTFPLPEKDQEVG